MREVESVSQTGRCCRRRPRGGATPWPTQPLHLFIVHHDPLLHSPPSNTMKKLFGRDKPKAVKVTPSSPVDISGLGEVRSRCPSLRPRTHADLLFPSRITRTPPKDTTGYILARTSNGISFQKRSHLYSPCAPRIHPRLLPSRPRITRIPPFLVQHRDLRHPSV